MKYSVQIKYTNPAHEHVTLRRRVDTVTRLVEASSEDEALNRVANQHRALGFLIKEAEVMKVPKEENLHADEKEKKKKKVVGDDEQETDIASAGGVKEEKGGTESYPLLKKGEKLKPMKIGEGFDPEPKDIAAHLIDKHGKGKVTKDHVDAYEKDRDSNKGIDKEAVMKHVQKMSEEVEQIDERNKENKAKKDAFVSKLGQTEKDRMVKSFSGMKIQKNYGAAAHAKNLKSVKDTHTKTYGRGEVKTDNMPRSKNYRGSYEFSNVGEEVESVEESVATAQKVMDRAKVVANTNPDPKKRFAASGLAQKAMLRTINPTGVNTGIVRGGGNKTYRMVTGKVPPYQLTKKTGVSEEVEQIDELKKSTLASYVKKATRDVASASRLQRGYETDAARSEFAPVRRGSELAAKNMRKFAGKRSRGIAKAVDKLAKEEVDTDKRDAGYKMSPAVRKAQAASDALSKREKKPQAGTLAALKTRKAAEKMVNKAKGKMNKVNMSPELEPGKPNNA